MKKLSKIAAIFAFAAAFFAGCASAPKRDANAEHSLVILHTNDHHGAVVSKGGKAGLAERATFIKQERENSSDILVLDAGDINTGTAVSNMFEAKPDILAYNKMGYDAVTFGNHEFDSNLEKIRAQQKESAFPWLSANIKEGKKYLGKPYITKNFGDYKVGIFGLTTRRTLAIAAPDKSLTFTDEIETAKEMVKVLRGKEKCDIVILLGHLGDIAETDTHETSLKVAESVEGIDLIIDGHSHTFFAEPKVVNGTPIVTANESGKYVGRAEMKIKGGKIEAFSWTPVEITAEKFAPDADVAQIVKPFVDKTEDSLKDVVLKTTAPFEFGKKLTRYQEMASGDFLTDGMVWYLSTTGVNVDFALTNGGGIRAEIEAGDVTKKAIITMLPFDNYVYVVTLKGEDVKALFDFIGSIKQGAGAFAQVSSAVRYTITYDDEGNGSISNVTINGEPIDEARTYRIAVNDYNAKGGDGYEVLTPSIDTYTGSMLFNDVFIEYAKTFGEAVTPKTDGRITVINGKLPQ